MEDIYIYIYCNQRKHIWLKKKWKTIGFIYRENCNIIYNINNKIHVVEGVDLLGQDECDMDCDNLENAIKMYKKQYLTNICYKESIYKCYFSNLNNYKKNRDKYALIDQFSMSNNSQITNLTIDFFLNLLSQYFLRS